MIARHEFTIVRTAAVSGVEEARARHMEMAAALKESGYSVYDNSLSASGFGGTPLPSEFLERVAVLIGRADLEQRARWWCNLNGWKWPAEWPTLPHDVIPREQYTDLVHALGDDAYTRAKALWRERVDTKQSASGDDELATVSWPRWASIEGPPVSGLGRL